MAKKDRITATVPDEAMDWAEALSGYELMQRDFDECSRFYAAWPDNHVERISVLGLLVQWMHDAYPNVWARVPGITFGDTALALSTAIVTGQWSDFVARLQSVVSNRADLAHVFVVTLPENGSPPSEVTGYLPFVLYAAIWGDEERAVTEFRENFRRVIDPELAKRARRPTRRGRGARPLYRAQVAIYTAWMRFCWANGGADPKDKTTHLKFIREVMHKTSAVDTSAIWNTAEPKRTGVKALLDHAMEWLPLDPAAGPLREYLHRKWSDPESESLRTQLTRQGYLSGS